MKNTHRIIEAVRRRTQTGTDYAVAKALGIDQSNLRDLIRGERSRKGLGPAACFKAAQLLETDPAQIIAQVELDKARSEEMREFWVSVGGGKRPVYYGKSKRQGRVNENIARH